MEIVSIGRFDLLIEVLNGLAALTSTSGPAGYGGMVALGLLIGVIITIARGIVTQKLELQWVLMGWLLYACLYVPKVTVTVRDIYTGTTTSVDNVPLGPAAIGMVTSQVGVTLADAFGAVFSAPSFTQTGYMDALDLIDSFNKMDYGDANDGRLGNRGASTVDVQRSLNNYLTDCTLYSMSMSLPGATVSWSTLRETSDLLTAIRVEANTWFATMYLREGFPDGQVMTCTQAYADLSAFLRSTFLTPWQTEIGRKLGLEDPAVDIQNAVDSLFGVGRDSQVFMLNTLIKKQLELSELGYQAKVNNAPGLIMRTQAMEQRRAQWGAEQSLFQEVARPLMAYIEAFFYAVSPIAAFTFLLGAPGVTLFGRYLLLALWIQLWMPIMAINNLYVSMAASTRIQAISASGFDPMSMLGLDNVWTQTQSWLATGGMMAAATPLLALMLITGSYYAFTSLTNRMGGGDFINEKIAAPDIMQPAAFATVGGMGLQQSQYMNDPFHGTYKNGAIDVIPNINVSRGLSSTLQSKESHAEDVSQRFLQDASVGGSLTRTQDTAGFVQSLVTQQGSSRATRTDQVLENVSRSVMNDDQRYNSMSKQERAAFDGAVSLGLMGMGSGGKIGGLLQHVKAEDEGERKSWADRIERLATHGQAQAVDLARAIASDEQTGVRSQFVNALGVRDEDSWSEATETTLRSIRGYDEIDTLNQVRGVQQNIDTLAIANSAKQEGWFGELVGLASGHGLYNGDIQNRLPAFAKRHGLTEDVALGVLLSTALGEGSSTQQAELAKLMNDHGFFTTHAEPGDPHHNSGIKSRAEGLPDPASVREGVNSHLSTDYIDPVSARGSIDNQVDKFGQPGSTELWDRGQTAVRSFFDAALKNNKEQLDRAMGEIEDVAKLEKEAAIGSTWQDTRSFLRAASEKNLWEGIKADTGLERLTHSLGAGSARLISTTDDTMEKTGDPVWAAVKGLGAGAAGLFEGAVNLPQDRYLNAYSEARSLHLPDDASSYYAHHYKADLGSTTDRMILSEGLDPAYNQLKAQVTEKYGELTVKHLERAATSDEDSRGEYLQDALSLIEARQVHDAAASGTPPQRAP